VRELSSLRSRIDKIDREILNLLEKRVKLARKIGVLKKKKRLPIIDEGREEDVYARLSEKAKPLGLAVSDIRSIYREIMRMCTTVQSLQSTEEKITMHPRARSSDKTPNVAFQGEVGAYSEQAVFLFFGPTASVRPCKSLRTVFETIEKGESDFGVVPIENSLEGSVNETYDLLLDSSLQVSGEINLRVVHCLIANPETQLSDIKVVYSHPQALAQCRRFLETLNCEVVSTYDTAGSVKMIRDKRLVDSAAIASEKAAEVYGMKIIRKAIEDSPNNYTRFFVLSKDDAPPSGRDKTSIIFSVKHLPGTLYDALQEFAVRSINLTKIESRPTKQNPWEYNFYLDFEGHRKDAICKEALEGLRKKSTFVKILGSYPRAS